MVTETTPGGEPRFWITLVMVGAVGLLLCASWIAAAPLSGMPFIRLQPPWLGSVINVFAPTVLVALIPGMEWKSWVPACFGCVWKASITSSSLGVASNARSEAPGSNVGRSRTAPRIGRQSGDPALVRFPRLRKPVDPSLSSGFGAIPSAENPDSRR